MGPPRRKLQATVEETLNPPASLSEGQLIAKIITAAGNNLYRVESSSSETLLVELEARFRSTIWLKRGGYVLIDTTTLADRENKIDGEIINIVRDEKRWMKQTYWPKTFQKKTRMADSSDEECRVGQMPPSDSEPE